MTTPCQTATKPGSVVRGCYNGVKGCFLGVRTHATYVVLIVGDCGVITIEGHRFRSWIVVKP